MYIDHRLDSPHPHPLRGADTTNRLTSGAPSVERAAREHGMIQFRRKPKFPYVSLLGTYKVRTVQVNVRESYWFGYRSSTDLESR